MKAIVDPQSLHRLHPVRRPVPRSLFDGTAPWPWPSRGTSPARTCPRPSPPPKPARWGPSAPRRKSRRVPPALPGGTVFCPAACPGGAVCVILDGDGAADARPFCTWAAHTGRNHAMSLLVVDGNSIANRAFFGIKVLTTKEGQYTNAIYGFMNILLSLTQNYQPDEVAIAFDLPAPTFRHKMYDGYKANRHGMPDELAAQMPLLAAAFDPTWDTNWSPPKGGRPDDILGTLAAACDKRGETCYPCHRRPGQPAARQPPHHRPAGHHLAGPQRDPCDGPGGRAGKIRPGAPGS